METGEKIKKMREMRNFTQEYMAQQLGISQAAYSKIEHNDIKLKGDKLKRIAEILQTDVDSIESFDEKAIFNMNLNNNNNSNNGYIYNVSFAEKALYEKQILILEKHITHLEEYINVLKSEIITLRQTK